MRYIFSFFALAIVIVGVVFAQEGEIVSGGEEIPVSLPASQLATPETSNRDVENVAKMVLSGEVKVDHTGKINIVRDGLGRAEVRRIVNQKAEVARINARKHGHAIGNEAVRKANLVANKAVDKATNYTDRKVSGLEVAIANAANWGKWGVGLAVLALLGVLGLLFFLLFRVPREAYDPADV